MAIPTNLDIHAVFYNGTDIPLVGGIPVTQEKSVTPSESSQEVTPDSGKYLSKVTVGAISSSYVGSGISRKASADLTVNGATVTAPAGYYESSASKAVASGTAGIPTATKGTVSSNRVTVTPSVKNTTGYITGGTKTGTGVTVSASELVSGNRALTAGTSSQTNIDVTNYATVSVAPTPSETKTVTTNGDVTPSSGKLLSKVTVNVPGVVTDDATATAADISNGKTAYVASGKVTGSYVPVLEFTNVSVPVSAWMSDSTYFGYSYRAAVTCNGATSAMFPYVEFSNNDVDNGYFAVYAESYTNGVYIYSEIIPDSVITITKIRFFKEA